MYRGFLGSAGLGIVNSPSDFAVGVNSHSCSRRLKIASLRFFLLQFSGLFTTPVGAGFYARSQAKPTAPVALRKERKMYKKKHICEITQKKEIAKGIIDMKVYSPDIVEQASPGQFLNIRCSDSLNTVLRRPISICDVDNVTGELRFIFQIKGEGTSVLACTGIGDNIDILGPLGNPFKVDEKYSNPTLVGGGIGVFPLLMLAKKLKTGIEQNKRDDNLTTAYLGFRNKDIVVLEDEFSEICDNINIYTDDGSYGQKGFATDGLEKIAREGKTDIVYACGPSPMLKGVQSICLVNEIPCQLSMEQRMGCGIGACLVCACKTKKENDWGYGHVCKDGPVFWGDEVIFDE
jgi:dihydroorotate dehydrogenase electron transfer subunit